MDIFNKCGAYTEAKDVMATGLYPYFIPLEKNEGTEADHRRSPPDHVRFE